MLVRVLQRRPLVEYCVIITIDPIAISVCVRRSYGGSLFMHMKVGGWKGDTGNIIVTERAGEDFD